MNVNFYKKETGTYLQQNKNENGTSWGKVKQVYIIQDTRDVYAYGKDVKVLSDNGRGGLV